VLSTRAVAATTTADSARNVMIAILRIRRGLAKDVCALTVVPPFTHSVHLLLLLPLPAAAADAAVCLFLYCIVARGEQRPTQQVASIRGEGDTLITALMSARFGASFSWLRQNPASLFTPNQMTVQVVNQCNKQTIILHRHFLVRVKLQFAEFALGDMRVKGLCLKKEST